MQSNQSQQYCPVCHSPMIYVNHWEFDGFDGSHEPYWECPEKCDPEIDTCTEFGVIELTNQKGSFIL